MKAHRPPWRIAVLCGGTSAEREISLQSGTAVANALRQRGHRATVIDPQQTDVRSFCFSPFDVVFIALHGTFGEDGDVQRLLERGGIPFTGSGSGASRLAFHKSAAKERFVQFHVPTPPAALVHETLTPDRLAGRAQTIGFPLVVKPDAQGSSLGVSLVQNPAELSSALQQCFSYHPFGLLEGYVSGTEWTVAVFDETVFPPLRIEPKSRFFDYRAKYEDDRTGYGTAENMASPLQTALTTTARRACRALGTRGAARVDLIVDEGGRPWVLEVNTIPGMTDHSLLPQAAAAAGVPFPELCEQMVQHALTIRKQRAA